VHETTRKRDGGKDKNELRARLDHFFFFFQVFFFRDEVSAKGQKTTRNLLLFLWVGEGGCFLDVDDRKL